MPDESEQVIDGYCIVKQDGAEIEFGTPTGMARDVVLIHAVKVTGGVLEAGGRQETVSTVCNHEMPRRNVRQDRSWEDSVPAQYVGGARVCKVCDATVGVHRVYGGKTAADYHLVTQSSVNLGDWTSVCVRLVDPKRTSRLWGEGGAAGYCDECDAIAGDSMRAQMAREEAEKAKRGFDYLT